MTNVFLPPSIPGKLSVDPWFDSPNLFHMNRAASHGFYWYILVSPAKHILPSQIYPVISWSRIYEWLYWWGKIIFSNEYPYNPSQLNPINGTLCESIITHGRILFWESFLEFSGENEIVLFRWNFLILSGLEFLIPYEETMIKVNFFFQKLSIRGLNSNFPFNLTDCHTKVKRPSLPYYLFIPRGINVGFILLPWVPLV